METMETTKQGENYQTKFKVTDEVFFLHKGKILSSKVHLIKIEIGDENKEYYWFKVPKSINNPDWEFATKDHAEVFSSRQDLINSL
jgi:hypothetical protein